MADIFISYATSNRDTASTLAVALEARGFSIWWDREIDGGDEFSVVIDTEIARAKAVLVLWSKDAIKSRWVRDEASEGVEQGKLIPLFIEDVQPPMGFRQIHTLTLHDRKPIHTSPGFEKLLDALRKRIPASNRPGTPSEQHRPAAGSPNPGAATPMGLVRARLHKWLFPGAIAAIVLLPAVVTTATLKTMQQEFKNSLYLASQDRAKTLALALSANPDAFRDPKSFSPLLTASFDSGHFAELVFSGPTGTPVFQRKVATYPVEVPEWFIRALPLDIDPGMAQVQSGWRDAGKILIRANPKYNYIQLWNVFTRGLAFLGLALVVTVAAVATVLFGNRKKSIESVNQSST